MKQKGSHQRRADSIRHFLSTNKLFMIIALVVVTALIAGMIHEKQKQYPQVAESSQAEETEQETEVNELPAWRFYPSDLVILLVGGGICVVMIMRERKKAKEELD